MPILQEKAVLNDAGSGWLVHQLDCLPIELEHTVLSNETNEKMVSRALAFGYLVERLSKAGLVCLSKDSRLSVAIDSRMGMTGNVKVTGSIEIPAAEQPELCDLFEEHARLSRAEPGCLCFETTRDPERAGKFHVSELFVDKAAFAAHRERTAASEWGRRSGNATRQFDRSVIGADGSEKPYSEC